jgi:hypothetical protein
VYSAAGASKRVFTLDFDNVAYQNGIYLDASADSIQYVSDPEGSGKSAQFDGASDIEVPYFQNNEFRQFTLALKFKQAAGGAVYARTCVQRRQSEGRRFLSSVDLRLNKQRVVAAGIRTEEGAFQIQSGNR